jgi:hypothetical protein
MNPPTEEKPAPAPALTDWQQVVARADILAVFKSVGGHAVPDAAASEDGWLSVVSPYPGKEKAAKLNLGTNSHRGELRFVDSGGKDRQKSILVWYADLCPKIHHIRRCCKT